MTEFSDRQFISFNNIYDTIPIDDEYELASHEHFIYELQPQSIGEMYRLPPYEEECHVHEYNESFDFNVDFSDLPPLIEESEAYPLEAYPFVSTEQVEYTIDSQDSNVINNTVSIEDMIKINSN